MLDFERIFKYVKDSLEEGFKIELADDVTNKFSSEDIVIAFDGAKVGTLNISVSISGREIYYELYHDVEANSLRFYRITEGKFEIDNFANPEFTEFPTTLAAFILIDFR